MKNILVITYWSYKEALIQSYTLPYLKIISRVLPANSYIYLFTLEKTSYIIEQNELHEIKNELLKHRIKLISFTYNSFGFRALASTPKTIISLFKLIRKENIKKIHCWCTPAGAFGYFLSILSGVPLIIDSFEPHAESMVENGTWKKNSLAYQLLFKLEKLQANRAITLIGLTKSMENYAKEKYGTPIKEYYVKPACVDLEKFNPFTESSLESEINKIDIKGKTIGIYAGKTGGIYLDQEIFDLFKTACDFWDGNFLAIILTSESKEKIKQYIEKSGIPDHNIIIINATHEQVPLYMKLAHFAINPVKPVPSKMYCTSIKDGEYWAMGLPVIITPNISDDSEIIESYDAGVVLKECNTKEYLNCISAIDQLLKKESNVNLKNRIRKIAEKYRNFKIAENIYKKIYLSK
ncbi:MAG: glycosyltransferase [Bacteroidota bacterium]|nr:glycosyltransferase [Bacteroidota bacterium]